MKYDLTKLKGDDYFIYQIVSRASHQTGGTHEVDVDKITHIAETTRARLIAAALAPPAPVTPAPPASALAKENQMSELNPAVMQVLRTWKPPFGMVNSEANGLLFVQTIETYFKNVYSHPNLDAAVAKLGDKIAYERGYSPSEAALVWNEWWNTYAPKNIQRSAANQAALKSYLDKFFNGLVTIQNLNLAQPNLSLVLVPEQSAQEHANHLAEKSAKAQARDLVQSTKDKLENSEAAFFERVRNAEKAKEIEKQAKAQAHAEEALNSEIMGYEAYGRVPNSRDWSVTNMVIADLKKIALGTNGKMDFVKTLALVRQVKSALPDAPKLGDVNRIVQCISERQQAAKANPVDKKTLEASSWANRPR